MFYLDPRHEARRAHESVAEVRGSRYAVIPFSHPFSVGIWPRSRCTRLYEYSPVLLSFPFLLFSVGFSFSSNDPFGYFSPEALAGRLRRLLLPSSFTPLSNRDPPAAFFAPIGTNPLFSPCSIFSTGGFAPSFCS